MIACTHKESFTEYTNAYKNYMSIFCDTPIIFCNDNLTATLKQICIYIEIHITNIQASSAFFILEQIFIYLLLNVQTSCREYCIFVIL